MYKNLVKKGITPNRSFTIRDQIVQINIYLERMAKVQMELEPKRDELHRIYEALDGNEFALELFIKRHWCCGSG